MDNIKILSARYGISDFETVVAEAQFEADGNEKFYISLAEADGMPNVFKTDESTIDKQLSSADDEEFFDKLNKHIIAPGDYEEILKDKSSEYYDIFRYMIYIVRAEEEDAEKFIKSTVGAFLNEITIPESDIEEEMK